MRHCVGAPGGCIRQGVAPQGLRSGLLGSLRLLTLLPLQHLRKCPVIGRLLLAQLLSAGLHASASTQGQHHVGPHQGEDTTRRDDTSTALLSFDVSIWDCPACKDFMDRCADQLQGRPSSQ